MRMVISRSTCDLLRGLDKNSLLRRLRFHLLAKFRRNIAFHLDLVFSYRFQRNLMKKMRFWLFRDIFCKNQRQWVDRKRYWLADWVGDCLADWLANWWAWWPLNCLEWLNQFHLLQMSYEFQSPSCPKWANQFQWPNSIKSPKRLKWLNCLSYPISYKLPQRTQSN